MPKKKAIPLTKEEIVKTLAEKREALRQFRFQLSGGRVKNVKLGGTLRKEIARLLTQATSLKS